MGFSTRLCLTLALSLCVSTLVAGLNFKISPKQELCFHEITHKGKRERRAVWQQSLRISTC